MKIWSYVQSTAVSYLLGFSFFSPPAPLPFDILTATVGDLSALLEKGEVTSVQLVKAYLGQIEKHNRKGLKLRAVIETAPYEQAVKIAAELDEQRLAGYVLSPLHGIPILLKDNIATDTSLGMNTTAGSYALLGMPVKGDATISAKLRQAGAIILGKANMSEWANWKGNITNGWSARGGQTSSAYVKNGFSNGGDPCGSSAGSGVGTSAGFAPASIGSETDGSIVCPSSRAALYGLKPTIGLVSRAGIVPISSTQDSAGPMAKSAYDCAVLLDVMAGADELDPATSNATANIPETYVKFTSAPFDSFSSYRLGIPRHLFSKGANSVWQTSVSGHGEMLADTDSAISKLAGLAAHVEDPVVFPSAADIEGITKNESMVLHTDFKVDLEAYLKGWLEPGPGPRTLTDIINWNDHHADLEFAPGECCQERLVESVQSTGKSNPEYIAAKAYDFDVAATRGIDAILDEFSLDALVLPSEGGWTTTIAAVVGYPIANVPLGYNSETGAPYGLSFIARKWREDILIGLMAAYEKEFPPRKVPSLLL